MHQNVIREKEKKRRKIVELIRINNIYKSFSNHQALEDVSFSISKGVILGLLGPNGAGKTTLIRILNQIIFPDSGEILFNNKPSMYVLDFLVKKQNPPYYLVEVTSQLLWKEGQIEKGFSLTTYLAKDIFK